MDESVVNFVKPLYMGVFGATYTRLFTDEGQKSCAALQAALSTVDEQMITQLLTTVDWRPRLTGSWLCGVKRWVHFADQIGALLVESKLCYAGSGYAFALARFADERSVGYLISYLDIYLRQVNLYFDQGQVLSALMWIDEQNGTEYSQQYLEPGGLWEHFVANKTGGWELESIKRRFFFGMTFCHENF